MCCFLLLDLEIEFIEAVQLKSTGHRFLLPANDYLGKTGHNKFDLTKSGSQGNLMILNRIEINTQWIVLGSHKFLDCFTKQKKELSNF